MSEAREIAVMLIRLGPFRRFRSSADRGLRQARRNQRPRVRNHVVHMGGDGTAFLFHDGEMLELCELLEGAHRALRRGEGLRLPARPSGARRDTTH